MPCFATGLARLWVAGWALLPACGRLGFDPVPSPDGPDPCGPLGSLVADAIPVACTAGQAPRVDGDLSDWRDATWARLAHAIAAHAGGDWAVDEAANDKNSSALFALRWDPNFLYIAVRVTDDVRVVDPSAKVQDVDAAEVYVDGQGDRTEQYQPDDLHLITTPDGRMQQYRSDIAIPTWTGIQARTASADGMASWNLETAVPWTALGVHPASGRVIGLDLQLDDNDLPAAAPMLARYLYWWDDLSLPCSTCSCQPSCSPHTWGMALLVGR